MHSLSFCELTYEARPPLLRGCHLRALSAEEITEACELLLVMAQRSACASWLLDGRATPYCQPAQLRQWLREEYWPRVQATLGQPLRVAFLVTATVRQELYQLGYADAEELQPALGHVAWFADAADALAWLHQPARSLPNANKGPGNAQALISNYVA